ncbi:MAG TPA: DUF4097 family beta strand repeat-containing protein [Vicinamibacterales bacterium]|nr:DUF4097 family beta strand repeat-containing protein [Vicinamibacterales bacterium]
MSRLSASLRILCAVCAITACDVKVGENGLSVDVAHGNAADEWKRTYHVTPGGLVDVQNVSGLLIAEPAGGPDVEVVATREVRASSDAAAREVLQKAEMIEQVSPDRVSIESRTNQENGLRSRLTVQITVRVPDGIRLTLKTRDGGVRLEGITSEVTASTVNGPITGHDISGAVTADTVNGPVRIDISKVTGDSRFTTVNGPVDLGLAPDLNASLEASVVNGAVMIDNDLTIAKKESTVQRVTGQINGGGPRIVAQTTNGAVHVRSGKLPERGGRRRRGAPPS